jgi:hypothetical protein
MMKILCLDRPSHTSLLRLGLLALLTLVTSTALGQQFSLGVPTFPIEVLVSPSGEISINSGGSMLLEAGELFVAHSDVEPVWERVTQLQGKVIERDNAGELY